MGEKEREKGKGGGGREKKRGGGGRKKGRKEEILDALDVVRNAHLITLLDQANGGAAYGSLERHTGIISARVLPQTEPNRVEPLELRHSETTRINVREALLGREATGSGRASARAPWPTSRRPGGASAGFRPTE